jgi:hypothetical protein
LFLQLKIPVKSEPTALVVGRKTVEPTALVVGASPPAFRSIRTDGFSRRKKKSSEPTALVVGRKTVEPTALVVGASPPAFRSIRTDGFSRRKKKSSEPTALVVGLIGRGLRGGGREGYKKTRHKSTGFLIYREDFGLILFNR